MNKKEISETKDAANNELGVEEYLPIRKISKTDHHGSHYY